LFLPLLVFWTAASAQTLTQILADELQRNFTVLKQKADPAPYFMAYEVTEEESQAISASLGALQGSGKSHTRLLDITVRVGTPKLDNYHIVRGERPRFTPGAMIPVDDVADAIRRKVWLETDHTWRAAARRLIDIKANTQMKVAQEDNSDDFSADEPAVHDEAPARLKAPDAEWTARLKKWSADLASSPAVLSSGITLVIQRETKYLVNTEGSRLVHGRTFATLNIRAQGKASDGMDLSANESFQASDLSRLPKPEAIEAVVNRVSADLAR
jgi:TldD protein